MRTRVQYGFWQARHLTVLARASREDAAGSSLGVGGLDHGGLPNDERSAKRQCHIITGNDGQELAGWWAASHVKPHPAGGLSGHALQFHKRYDLGWSCC